MKYRILFSLTCLLRSYVVGREMRGMRSGQYDRLSMSQMTLALYIDGINLFMVDCKPGSESQFGSVDKYNALTTTCSLPQAFQTMTRSYPSPGQIYQVNYVREIIGAGGMYGSIRIWISRTLKRSKSFPSCLDGTNQTGLAVNGDRLNYASNSPLQACQQSPKA